MRLAITTHNVTRGDGQGRVGYEIARYALEQGAQVTLLADRAEPDLIEMGATWLPVQPIRQPILVKVRDFVRKSNRILNSKRDQFDIIHGFGYSLACPHEVSSAQFVHHAWLRSPMHISRSRRDLWGLYQKAYTLLNSNWEMQAYRQAKRIVACSRQVRNELIAGGIPAERIEVIYNAVDLDEFRPGQVSRRDVGLPEGVPLALFVGDIRTERKNLGVVLRALRHAPGVYLAVVGALEGSPFPALAQRLGVADRVRFLGYRQDVGQIMRAIDVYVFPSRYEPFGIVVLEAMATGTPVVTAATVGAAEVVTPESGCVLPDPNDDRALADTLIEILNDPPLRACMGKAARAEAERHGWQRMTQSYFGLYESVVS